MRDTLLTILQEMLAQYPLLLAINTWSPSDRQRVLTMQTTTHDLQKLLLSDPDQLAKGRFISFETRQSLTTIIGNAELLLDLNPAVKARMSLREVRSCGTRLLAHVMLIASEATENSDDDEEIDLTGSVTFSPAMA